MRLFYAPASPYARKALVVLHETGQFDSVTLVQVSGTPLEPGTMPLAQNPLGKIPALERDGSPAIYDSRVICRFLGDTASGDARDTEGETAKGVRLYPHGERLWEALTLEATADGIMDAAVLMVYENRVRPEPLRMPEWIEGQWAKITRALDAIEGRWMAHLAGPLDIGQIALGCALGYLDLRHDARGWRVGRPDLAAWCERFGARPAMAATRPPAA